LYWQIFARDALHDALPVLLAKNLAHMKPMVLGPGCPDLLHNVITLYQYPSAECCEEPFVEDANGCLIGGQFNGHPVGWTEAVISVKCGEMPAGGQFAADCKTVPGGYYGFGPGTCRESDALPVSDTPSKVEDFFSSVRAMLGMEFWFVLIVTSALTCCCASFCASSPLWRSRSEDARSDSKADSD
jgi:hypothetical protein